MANEVNQDFNLIVNFFNFKAKSKQFKKYSKLANFFNTSGSYWEDSFNNITKTLCQCSRDNIDNESEIENENKTEKKEKEAELIKYNDHDDISMKSGESPLGFFCIFCLKKSPKIK